MYPTIAAVVTSGCGRAALAFTPKRLEEIEHLFGVRLYPGTLNLWVKDLSHAVRTFGEPAALTERDTHIGPLQWWPCHLRCDDMRKLLVPEALLVRGARTGTRYLEIAAPIEIRRLGVESGDEVTLHPGWEIA